MKNTVSGTGNRFRMRCTVSGCQIPEMYSSRFISELSCNRWRRRCLVLCTLSTEMPSMAAICLLVNCMRVRAAICLLLSAQTAAAHSLVENPLSQRLPLLLSALFLGAGGLCAALRLWRSLCPVAGLGGLACGTGHGAGVPVFPESLN